VDDIGFVHRAVVDLQQADRVVVAQHTHRYATEAGEFSDGKHDIPSDMA